MADSHGRTLDDLAAAAGVSRATTWRALKRPQSVSQTTREKVRSAAARIGYVPNRLASALRSQSSGQVGLVMPEMNYTFAPAAQAFADRMTKIDQGIILGFTGYDSAAELDVVRDMLGRQVAAIVLTGSEQLPETLDLIRVSATPLVRIWSDRSSDISFDVGFSNRAVGARAADHFHETGRRNPALLMTADRPRANARSDGFIARWVELFGSGQDIRHTSVPEYTTDLSEAMVSLFAAPTPDALFVNGDLIALQAIGWCAKNGLEVPGDVAVLGFGNRGFTRFTRPAISTFSISETAIGQAAGDILARVFQGEDAISRARVESIELIRRDST